MTGEDFDARYEKYIKEARDIMSREKTACLTRTNTANPPNPKSWARIDMGEAEVFWEKSKCLTI
jgi:hypothetical protein